MEQQLNSSTGFWANDDNRDKEDFEQLSPHDAKLPVSRRLTSDDMSELIEKHIAKMWGGLEMASVQHFIDTGKINGSFRLRLLAMLQFADWKLERLENGG